MAEPLGPEDAPLTEDPHCWSVFISGDSNDEESEPLAHWRVQAHDRDAVRHLILVRGVRTKQTDRIVESYGKSGGRIAHLVTDDKMLAIGYYIQLLELHELDEGDMYAGLEDAVPDLYSEYKTWRAELDVSDRRLRLLDQAEADTEWDPLYEDIIEQGKWRTATHDSDLQGFARALHRQFDFDSSGCYRNARLVMQDDRYWENDRVQYVEGISLSKHAARITGHGWIEHDERVVELTWPWHSPLPPEETVYFGRSVSRRELQDSWDRGEHGPYILNDDASQIV